MSFEEACRRADEEAAKRANGNGHDESEIIQLEIKRMAKLHPVQYDRERELAAQRLGIRISTLDRQVEAEHKRSGDDNKQGQALLLPEPEPWPDPLNGAELLCALSAAIRRHVVMPEHSADATALWALQTYMLDAVHISPRLAVTSRRKAAARRHYSTC
jgi:putative DNA primase/helicase